MYSVLLFLTFVYLLCSFFYYVREHTPIEQGALNYTILLRTIPLFYTTLLSILLLPQYIRSITPRTTNAAFT